MTFNSATRTAAIRAPHNTLHSLVLAVGCLILMAMANASRGATEVIDQVVAIVDNDVIMASELRTRVNSVKENLKARDIESPPEETLVRETLDRLILESIQLQKGTRAGVRISDEQLNGAVQRIAAQNRMSLDQFRQAVEAQGQSYAEMREQIRREMIIQRVQAGNVNQRIQISDQEVNNFVATQDGQKLTQPEFHLLHALLAIPPDAETAQIARAKAHVDELLQRIRKGEDFAAVVSSSGGPFRFSGGDLGWRNEADLPSLFSDVAPTLRVGQTADPIHSESGIHLIHLQDARGIERMVEQTKARHILIKPSEIRSDDQARELAESLKERARGGENFGDLAREYSADIGSAQEGGDLGWTMPGQMVPEFEAAMAKTRAGEISDPVRTQFGWHLIQVEGRREQDMTAQATRAKAMDYLHGRKFQEELDAWLQQIRDEAFVDIK